MSKIKLFDSIEIDHNIGNLVYVVVVGVAGISLYSSLLKCSVQLTFDLPLLAQKLLLEVDFLVRSTNVGPLFVPLDKTNGYFVLFAAPQNFDVVVDLEHKPLNVQFYLIVILTSGNGAQW
jgi:hypothetical protein